MASDRIEVTVADLAAALEGFHVEVTSPFREQTGATNADGVIAAPELAAAALFNALSVSAAHREPCVETSNGGHTAEWHDGGRCRACGLYGPQPENEPPPALSPREQAREDVRGMWNAAFGHDPF